MQLGLSGPRPAASLDAPPNPRPMAVSAFGMQLHAASTVDGRDRKRLERAVSIRERTLGKDHAETVRARAELARLP